MEKSKKYILKDDNGNKPLNDNFNDNNLDLIDSCYGFMGGNMSYMTNQNTFFRKVVATSPNMQLVLMSINPKEDSGLTKHPYTTELIRIESGVGLAQLGMLKTKLYPGKMIFIYPGLQHNIINIGETDLKLYSIYSPPVLPKDLIQKNK